MRSLFTVVSPRTDNAPEELASPLGKDAGPAEAATAKPPVLPNVPNIVFSAGNTSADKYQEAIARRERHKLKVAERRERLTLKAIARLEQLKKEPCPKDNPIVLDGMDFSGYDFGAVSLQHVRMKDTNLVGAKLENCTHLSPQQVAGANLHHATVPEDLEEAFDNGFDFLTKLNNKIGIAEAGLFGFLILLIMVALITGDSGLITNRGTIPTPIINLPLPPSLFAFWSPAIAFGFFVWIHCHIQKYWHGLEKMPAVFPDGTPLSSKGVPWLATGCLERYYPHLVDQYHEPYGGLFADVFLLGLYWMTPLAISIMAWRDLSLHNWALTNWHIALITASCVLATIFRAMMVDTFRIHAQRRPKSKPSRFASSRFASRLKLKSLSRFPRPPRPLRVALWGMICLCFCKAWATNDIEGWQWMPLDFPSKDRNLRLPREARLSKEKLSKQPDGWFPPDPLIYTPSSSEVKSDAEQKKRAKIEDDNTVRRQKLMQVQGTILNGQDLNYAIADGAFFVNAKMRATQLENAYLKGAQMQNADISGANLCGANLTEANLQDAIFSDIDDETAMVATLKGANLTKANLRYAHLSNVSLAGATLARAQFQGATMVDVDLSNIKAGLEDTTFEYSRYDTTPVRIVRSNGIKFEGANLERAFMMGSDFTVADWGGANLSGACLIGCSLDSRTFNEDTNLEGAIICAGEIGHPDGKNSHNATRIAFTGFDKNGKQTGTGCIYITYGTVRKVYELIPITAHDAAMDPDLYAWKKEIEFLANRKLDSLLPSLRRLRFVGSGESGKILGSVPGGFKPLQGLFPAPAVPAVNMREPYHRRF